MLIRAVQACGDRAGVQIAENYRTRGGPLCHRILQHFGTAEPGPALTALREQAEYCKEEMQVVDQPARFSGSELVQLAIAARQHPRPERSRPDWISRRYLRESHRLILGGHEAIGNLFDQAGRHRIFSVRQQRKAA